MDCRRFEVTVLSATDLKSVRKLFKMKVYARVSIGSFPDTKRWTPVDRHGKVNPAWNFTLTYTINESWVHHHNAMLVIQLYCRRKLGDRYIGEVSVPMKELFENSMHSGGSAIVTHQVLRGSAPSQGVLRFSYRFGERINTYSRGY